MAADAGTATSIKRWLASLTCGAESRFELRAFASDGEDVVLDWTAAEVDSDVEGWAERVSELADVDAAGRGITTRYELRHYRGDAVRGVHRMRRVVGPQGADYDGSTSSVIQLLLRANERANAQVIEAGKAAITAQSQALKLLGESYAASAALASQLRELQAELAAVRATGGAAEGGGMSPVFRALLAEVMPHVVPELVKVMKGAEGASRPSVVRGALRDGVSLEGDEA